MTLATRLAIAALLLAPLTTEAATAPGEDPFADFRIPDHRVFSWTGDLSSNAAYTDGSSPFGSGNGGFAGGSLSTSMFSLHDSDPKTRAWSAHVSAGGSRSSNESQSLFSDRSRRARSW